MPRPDQAWWSLGLLCHGGSDTCGGTAVRSGSSRSDTSSVALLIDILNALAMSAFDTATVSILGWIAIEVRQRFSGGFVLAMVLVALLGFLQNVVVVVAVTACVDAVSWAPFAPLPGGCGRLFHIPGHCPVTVANQFPWLVLPLLTGLWVHIRFRRTQLEQQGSSLLAAI
mmetsp:Transcript_8162/g.29673  ORF Transcript_8162/g.29673 Transcript_8162/m.29673 type:complete len:170 (-) Transcript_8162:56-565(-)